DRVLVRVDLVEPLDRCAVRLRLGAAADVRDPATGVEQDVERVVEPGHRRALVDARAYRAGKRAVGALPRGDAVAAVRLARLVRVEDGGEKLGRRRGAKLVVDDDRDALLAGEQLSERRPGDGARKRLARRGVGAADRLGLVRVDRGEQVRARNLQLELFAVDL